LFGSDGGAARQSDDWEPNNANKFPRVHNCRWHCDILSRGGGSVRTFPRLALRVISLQRSISVAFGAKQTWIGWHKWL
jgi:hypothetical protein